MSDLIDFVRQTAERNRAHPRLEEALLTEDGRAYVAHRLRYLLLRAPLRTVLHVMEVFLFAGVIWPEYLPYFFVLRAGVAVTNGLLWGALESLRDQVRGHMRQREPMQARAVIERWLGFGLCLVAAVAITSLVYLRWAPTPFSSFSILDAYAIAVFLRLAMDVMGRIHHAGVFAIRRVYRPFWSLLLTDLLDVGLVVLLFGFVGPWAFAPALIVAGIVKHGLTVAYTQRTYRSVDGLAPRLFRVRPRVLTRAELVQAVRFGLANLSGQLDAWVVLALATSVVVTGSSDGVALAAVLHMSRPLLATGTGWSRLFYFDFKRMGSGLSSFLRARFDRLLLRVAWLMGGLVTVVVVGGASALPGTRLSSTMFGLLGLFILARSLFGLGQLQAFVDGQFRRLFWQSASVIAGLGVVAVVSLPPARALVVLTMALLAGAMVPASTQAVPKADSKEPLPLVNWVAALRQCTGPVVLHVARIDRKVASPRQASRTLACWLGDRGRVAFAPKRHVVWFEWTDDLEDPEVSREKRSELSVISAGAIVSHVCGSEANGGEAALQAALRSGQLPASLAAFLQDTPSHRQARAQMLLSQNPAAVLIDARQGRLPVLPGVDRRTLVEDVLVALRRAADGELRTTTGGLRVHVLGPAGPVVAEPRF